MKYGILGGFIKLAFAKTAFAYMEEAIPELDMVSYKKCVLREYRAIVERTLCAALATQLCVMGLEHPI